MITHTNPNMPALGLAAQELKPLLDEFVLVGGCAVGLLITDNARPPVRFTIDIDLLTEVASLANYYLLCEKLQQLGFQQTGSIICRWSKGDLLVDVMPTDESVLGFTNRWYDLALKTAVTTVLPNGLKLRHISAPLFIATKIESFHDRGNRDFRHHDIEDIVNIIDGRVELIEEIRAAPHQVRIFIQQEIDDFLAQEDFVELLHWHLLPEQTEQNRLVLVISRLRQMAGL